MYFFIGFLLLLVLCLGFCFWRRRRAIKKVCCMSCREKQDLLDTILEPFGYYYVCDQDLISTRNDAWQRQAGYRALFDKAALRLHIVFDALPIYFNHCGRTWLIELWKGQYGINTGAEVGIYQADGLLSPEKFTRRRRNTPPLIFRPYPTVNDCPSPSISFTGRNCWPPCPTPPGGSPLFLWACSQSPAI